MTLRVLFFISSGLCGQYSLSSSHSSPRCGIGEQYSPSEWSHRFRNDPNQVLTNYIKVTSTGSQLARKIVPPEEVIYAPESPDTKLDIYGANVLPEDSPIFVFFHGGYWMMGSRQYSSYMVPPLYRNGIVSIIVGYSLIPKVTLDEIVCQAQKAVSRAIQLAKERCSKGIYLCGHSAGSHLAAMVMSTAKQWMPPSDLQLIKGVIHISGIMNLMPLLDTTIKQQLSITQEIAIRNSPQLQVDALVESLAKRSESDLHMKDQNESFRMLVLVAEHDSPAFQEQAKEYYKTLCDASLDAEFMLIEGEDHSSVAEKLQDDEFVLTKKIIDFIKKE